MNGHPIACERRCVCEKTDHQPGLVVVTGGPGAGKTAILEMAKKNFCQHIASLPESASIVFGGGFWRLKTTAGKMASQRAIYHIQRELEGLVLGDGNWALGLCDRGTLDGLAYWPQAPEVYWEQVGSSMGVELARYQAVIHLRTPSRAMGYNNQNTLRTETAEEAQAIDERIAQIWSKHPNYTEIPSSNSFMRKAQTAIQIIGAHIPECCRLPE